MLGKPAYAHCGDLRQYVIHPMQSYSQRTSSLAPYPTSCTKAAEDGRHKAAKCHTVSNNFLQPVASGVHYGGRHRTPPPPGQACACACRLLACAAHHLLDPYGRPADARRVLLQADRGAHACCCSTATTGTVQYESYSLGAGSTLTCAASANMAYSRQLVSWPAAAAAAAAAMTRRR
jgi:hypothetical protein